MIITNNGEVKFQGSINKIETDMVCVIKALRDFYKKDPKYGQNASSIEDRLKYLYEISLLSTEEIDHKIIEKLKEIMEKYSHE